MPPALRALAILGRVSTLAAAWLAERFFFRPRRHRRPIREEVWLEGAEPLHVPLGLGALNAWNWGEGPTVVLVHGWEGRGSQLGAFVAPLVAAGFRVVAFDAPAHGDSPGNVASIVTFADALAATVRRVGGAFAVVAHSMGAASTIFAMTGGLDIQRVVFVASADAGLALHRFTDFVGLPTEVRDRMAARVRDMYGMALSELSGPALAPSMRAPMLAIHDVEDVVVPWSDSSRIVAAWPTAELRTTSGLGHRRILRDPNVVAKAIDFIRREAS